MSYNAKTFPISDDSNYTLNGVSSKPGDLSSNNSDYTWKGSLLCNDATGSSTSGSGISISSKTKSTTTGVGSKKTTTTKTTYGIEKQPDFCLDSNNTKVGVNVNETSAKLLDVSCTVNSNTGKASKCTATYGWNPPCPAGKYCATAKDTPVDCLQGSYCPQCPGPNCPSCSLDSFGTTCPVSGKDYAKAGNTNIGMYANIFGTISAPIPSMNNNGNNATSWSAGMCPPGYYCPTPSSTPIACPVGQTSPIGSTSNSACS